MEYMSFNFVTKPNQVLVKGSDEENDDFFADDSFDGEEDINDFFDTGEPADFIAGHFRKADYDKGIFSIKGELTAEEIETLLKKTTYIQGNAPNIYEVKQSIENLEMEWELEWEVAELKDSDGDLI